MKRLQGTHLNETLESIMQELDEVKAQREGKRKTTTIEIAPLPRYNARMVKALRLELGLSQSIFADVLGVSRKTVEAWESGRNAPSGVACRLLEIIRKDRGLLKREKIIIYNSFTAKTRVSKAALVHNRCP